MIAEFRTAYIDELAACRAEHPDEYLCDKPEAEVVDRMIAAVKRSRYPLGDLRPRLARPRGNV